MIDEVPKKKTVSVKFCHAVLSLLGFLTLEAGTDRLSHNVAVELPLYAASIFRRAQISHDLVMQTLVWLCMVWFRVIRFGVVWFGASYMSLRQPHTFKCQI